MDIVQIYTTIKRSTEAKPNQFEGVIRFSLESNSIEVNYSCDLSKMGRGYLDFKFTENTNEFHLQGVLNDGILRQLTPRQNVLYFACVRMVVDLAKSLNGKGKPNAEILKNAKTKMERFHTNLIFKKDQN